jgi:cytochrome c biogenesis protein
MTIDSNTTPSSKSNPTPTPPNNFWQMPQRWWRKQIVPVIANLKFAIALVLIIALLSVSGTLIEQGETPGFYQANYPEHPALFGFLSWKVIQVVGLDHVYRTWWYLGLLVLFGISLITCTFTTQLPMLKSARKWKFYDNPKFFQKLALSAEIDNQSLNNLSENLQAKKYLVFTEGDKMYARKGLIGKIGPIVVHVGMILTLLGGVWGALTGFIGQEMIPSGDTFQVKNILDAGPLAQKQIPKDWSVKVNRFWIDYTPAGTIDQFYSDLSVVDNASQKELDRQTIHVNKPLKYDGVYYYQTDWSISGVKIQLNNSPIFKLPMAQLGQGAQNRIWGTWIPTKPDLSEGVSLLAKDLQGTLLVYDTKGQLVSSVRAGNSVEVNGVTLKILDLIGGTGLQIKADPGIPVVYLGFGLLMVGVIMSYFSHSQVWAVSKDGKLYLGGRTNRAQVVFEREIIEIIEQLNSPVYQLSIELEPVGIERS